VAIALLVASSIGIVNGAQEWSGAVTAGQKLATIAEFGYGILGPLGAIALYRGWTMQRPILLVWAALVGITAGLAPVVWGDQAGWTGLLSGIGAGLVGIAVIWMSNRPQGQPK
jgi:hypothetical protein